MPKKKGTMTRLAEGVYRRDGRIIVKWWEPDGKGGGSRKQETLPAGTTVAQAKTFKGRKEDEKSKRRHPIADERVERFQARWTTDYPRPEETSNMYNRERSSKFAEDFKGRKMGSFERSEAYRWALENKTRVKAVAAMFADAVRYEHLDENPFTSLGLPVARGRARDAITLLTSKELTRLIEIADGSWGGYGKVFGSMIGVAAWTGMRPSELYGLEWSQVDLVNRTINIDRAWKSKIGQLGLPKMAHPREIALLDEAAFYLERVPKHPSEPWVFYTKQFSRMQARTHHWYWGAVRMAFWNSLSAERQKKIKPDFEFYELRHAFGSYLAHELKMTPYDIAQQMGHRDGGRLAMKLYIHTEQDASNERVLEAAKAARERHEQKRKAS